MFEQVKEILVEELGTNPDVITLEAELVNDLGINSFELANLVIVFEERFDVEVKEADLPTLSTVGDIVEYLSK